MSNKERYRAFCTIEKNIPIFSKDWWLDGVCGENNWDVVIFEKGGEIWASMPYFIVKKSIFEVIGMPKLTQTMGAFIKYPNGQKYYKKLSWEKEVIEGLISQLPSVDAFTQNMHHSLTNWLPFYWAGYEQTTKYTYVIESTTNLENLEKNFETDIRRRRKKAFSLGVDVFESDDIELFYALNKQTFQRQGVAMPYSLDFITRLYKKANEYNAVKMYVAKYNGEVIAANFLVYDDNTVYYLMGGIDASKKDLGAMDLVQYESIKFALETNRIFDFEGSMIENIEKYFRSFGAIQKPYFTIYKTHSKLLKLRKAIRDIFR